MMNPKVTKNFEKYLCMQNPISVARVVAIYKEKNITESADQEISAKH